MSGRIAPHEGNEIDLVIAGDKPLAVIERRKDPDQYKRALHLKGPAHWITRIGAEGAEVIISLKSGLIADYLALQAGGITQGTDEYHRRMGALFGYSEADIAEFIANPPACDCSKCNASAEAYCADPDCRCGEATIGKVWTHGKPEKYGRRTNDARRTQFHAK